ncbi:MAG: AraC family transcriptional regulator [Clostridiales Family XIII bacterium]|jgi:AraC-like DNA-binding protein|nr:AraC family transcriptional regulator [Clostridiales Family XIII bacterium]
MAIIAEHDALNLKTTGYRHYTRDFERRMIDKILKGELARLNDITIDQINFNKLADEPLRSLKNNMICIVTLLGRAVIDAGAEAEKSFSIGDSYINRLERLNDAESVRLLVIDMVGHYAKLLRDERLKNYSLPIMRAIRYIHSHLYETCSTRDIARHLGLHTNYLSALFRKETGVTLTAYIKRLKLEEAKRLLLAGETRVMEIAEMLGYNSVSYFSKDFTKWVGSSPKRYAAGAKPPETGGG